MNSTHIDDRYIPLPEDTLHLEGIQAYRDLDGLQLIPLHAWNHKTRTKNGEAVDRGKSPSKKGWQNQTHSFEEITEHMSAGKNVGCHLRDGWLVLDVDPKNWPDGRDVLAEFLEACPIDLSLFPCVLTGGFGKQFYGRLPSGFRPNWTSRDFPGLEFRFAPKHQCVVPGSKHPNGRIYEWCPFGIVGEGDPPDDRETEILAPGRWSTKPVALRDAPEWPEVFRDFISRKAVGREDSAPYEDSLEKGERNMALTSVAGRLRRVGFQEEAIRSRLLKENRERCNPPLPADEVGAIAKSMMRYPAERESLNDVGAAERFVRLHGDRFRHCEALGDAIWFVWDGKVWCQELRAPAKRAAKEVAKDLRIEAAVARDSNRRKALEKEANRCERRNTITAVLDLASAELEVKPDAFDSDWTLLGVQNGTLELRPDGSVNLRDHRRDDLLTRLTAVKFDPSARCDLWEGTLRRFLPDEELRAYLQRAFGYTLLGGQGEKAVFFAYGPPDGGKSTVVGALHRALGEYGATTQLNTFGDRSDSSGNTPALAKLHGPRPPAEPACAGPRPRIRAIPSSRLRMLPPKCVMQCSKSETSSRKARSTWWWRSAENRWSMCKLGPNKSGAAPSPMQLARPT